MGRGVLQRWVGFSGRSSLQAALAQNLRGPCNQAHALADAKLVGGKDHKGGDGWGAAQRRRRWRGRVGRNEVCQGGIQGPRAADW